MAKIALSQNLVIFQPQYDSDPLKSGIIEDSPQEHYTASSFSSYCHVSEVCILPQLELFLSKMFKVKKLELTCIEGLFL